ncbi:unnamed protein product [Miscanthus lutarioriparius]|uniref:Pentatricopeptide repeat-containing protein n=1 Tax=Miscanthus lutarioriparius TaxID=422564 RepID=A0A811PS83_9POAL|nr:unnamed protein product [Miscanthus lutarioriparius]
MASPAAKRTRDPSAPAFPTNKEAPDLPSKTRIFCDILASRADDDVDAALDKADIRGVTTADVEQVLRLSYAHPCAATAFFHWAGNRHLGHEHHSPYSWNLVVDILGTNRLFARMWDTVDSMHSRRLLSLDTFASVFSSLAASPGCSPLKAFMDDTPALNSLLSALCRADRLDDARAAILVARAEAGTRPDADSYAILLEGCEAAADPRAARVVFDEMGSLGHAEVIVDYLDDMIFDGVFPDSNTYNVVLQLLLEGRELRKAAAIFSEMVKNECWPNEGNCARALRLFLDARYWETGIKVWSCVVENGLPPLEECGNMLVSKLKDVRLPEACNDASMQKTWLIVVSS